MSHAPSLKSAINISLILAAGVSIAAFVNYKSNKDFVVATEAYQRISKTEVENNTLKVENSFRQIYQGIRTISFLPSVKSIDRYGENLDANAKESIIQIYNNLRSNVTVSEVYIVQADIEPERIDPVTGTFETPILMFDDAVAAHEDEGATEESASEEEKITTIAEAEKAEEVEIFEYRALKEQMTYLKAHYGDISKIDKMNLPFIGSQGVLTCDNGDFENTKIDADRTGAMLSVPFYGEDGKLKGAVTAVLRDNIMRDMLPSTDYALINTTYDYAVFPTIEGQHTKSKDWALKEKADPNLIFSMTQKLNLPDPQSQWIVWAGYPDDKFLSSGDAKTIENFRNFGYGFAVLFTLAGFGVYALIQRNFRAMERNNAELESKVAERAKEIENLAAEQERQKAIAEQERKKALHSMADSFEQSVSSVVAQVASASTQMQAGSAQVVKIADETKQVSSIVLSTSEESAQATAQVSAAAEELTASISEVSAQAQKSRTIAENVAIQAGSAKDSIEHLSEQSQKVGEIVGVITKISEQINMLALNATIESARAGEAGKGFAVVANEVKQLASQVNNAATQIEEQIAGMQAATQTSVDSVERIIMTIGDVTSSIQSVAGVVEEQISVTNDIARNISQMSAGASEISQSIAQVQNGADRTEETAKEVLISTENLTAQVTTLRQKVDEFMRTVRTS